MKRMVSLFLIICMLAAFCGCGTGDLEYIPTGDGLTPEDATGPAKPPQEEKEQNITMTYYPDRSMNPYLCSDFTNRALFPLIYQGLFSTDRNYNTVPILCSRFTVSADMRTYTFYLENATFSDGTPVTADDVMASLLAAKNSQVYGGRFLHVTGIGTSADGGVTVSMDTAYENLPILLDVPIVKAGQVAENLPLGTGPYYPDASVGGLRLRRRTNWWCTAEFAITAATIPLVNATSATQIRDEFQFGSLDFVCADPMSDRYADYRCDYELWDCENGNFLYIGCNEDSKIFDTAALRAALTYAIDRDALCSSFYHGFAQSATLPASPNSPYYNDSLAKRYGYDPVKFLQAVQAAGKEGSTMVLLVNSDDSLRLRVARAIAKNLTDCGLVVEMKELGGNAYLTALKGRQFDLYVGQTRLSANMDLSAFFSTYGTLSYGGVDDLTAYALCLESLANAGNYYTLHRTVMENGLLCPVLFGNYSVFVTRGVISGLQPARDNLFFYSLGRTLADAQE